MNTDLPNIGELLKQLRDDTATLLREEVALAKTEVGEKISTTTRNVGYLMVGGMVAYSALILMLMSLGFLLRQFFVEGGMEEGTATFLGLLIVGLVVGAIGAILVMKALKTLKNETITPTRTVHSLHEDKQWAQSKLS